MPAARPPARRAERRRVLSQNFLIDPAVIGRLVRGSGVGEGDLVLDIGAGNGLITQALADRGARVLAVEQDPVLARKLRNKFTAPGADGGRGGPAAGGGVTVIEGDVLSVALPREPYRVVANLPFGITTKILHHLLDEPAGMLRQADVIVQAEVARKRGTRGRGTLLNACWEPWFEFSAGPRIPPGAFRPQPRVDAAVLVIRSREEPLLDAADRVAYTGFVSEVFGGARPTVASALSRAVPRSRFAGVADSLGFGLDALPSQLRIGQWVGLFQAARSRAGGQGGGSGTRTGGRRAQRP